MATELERIAREKARQKRIKEKISKPMFEQTATRTLPSGEEVIEVKDIPVTGKARPYPDIELEDLRPQKMPKEMPVQKSEPQTRVVEDIAAKLVAEPVKTEDMMLPMDDLKDLGGDVEAARRPSGRGGMPDLLTLALMQAIPTLAGELLGGKGGAAIGAKAGQFGIQQLIPTRKQAFKEQAAREKMDLARQRIESTEQLKREQIEAARDLERLRQEGRLKREDVKSEDRKELEKLKQIGRLDLLSGKLNNSIVLTNLKNLNTRDLEKLKQAGRIDSINTRILGQKEIQNIKAFDTRSLEKLKQIGREDLLEKKIFGQKEMQNMKAFDAKDLEKLKQIGRLGLLDQKILGQKEIQNIKAFDTKALEKLKQVGRLDILDKKIYSQKEIEEIKNANRIKLKKILSPLSEFQRKKLEQADKRIEQSEERLGISAGMLEQRKKAGERSKQRLGMQREGLTLRQKQKIDREVENISKRVEKKNIAPLLNSFKRVNKLIPGSLIGSEDIPGYGQIEGGLADALVSAKGREIRQAVQEISNSIARANFGTAQTETELRKFSKQIGEGAFKTDKQLRDGLLNALSLVKSDLANIETSEPEAIEEFRLRGGVTSKDDIFNILTDRDNIIEKYIPSLGRKVKLKKGKDGKYRPVGE